MSLPTPYLSCCAQSDSLSKTNRENRIRIMRNFLRLIALTSLSALCVSAVLAQGVSSFNSRTGAVISGSSDYTAPQIGITAPGTGAVTTTVGAKLNGMVWIGDYGAVCNGLTNDTAAIQNAWNYAASVGRNVWLGGVGPSCVISSLTMPAPIVVSGTGNFGQARAAMLQGPGSTELTLISTVAGTSCAINISAKYGENSYIGGQFSGFGLKQTTNGRVGYGICMNGITKATIRDVSIVGFSRGMSILDTILINIVESSFELNSVHINGDFGSKTNPNMWNILNSHFAVADNVAINLVGPQAIVIQGNDFESNGQVALTNATTISIYAFNQATTHPADIIGNYFEDNRGTDLYLAQNGFAAKQVYNVIGNTFARTSSYQVSGITIANGGGASAHTMVNLAGNSFFDALASGVLWFQTSAATANYLWNCSQLPNQFSPTTNVSATCLIAATGFR